MFDLNMGAGGLSPCLRLPKFLHLFGNRTKTLADGTRQVVNEGINGRNRIKNLTTGKSFGTQAAWIDNGDGSYTCDGKTGGGERDLYVTNIIEQGVTYIVEVEIFDYVSGKLGWYFGAGSVIVGYSNGFHSYEVTARTTSTFTLHSWSSDGFVGSIRNIKVYKKTDLAQRLTLFSSHWKHFNGINQALPLGRIQASGGASVIIGFTFPATESSQEFVFADSWQHFLAVKTSTKELKFRWNNTTIHEIDILTNKEVGGYNEILINFNDNGMVELRCGDNVATVDIGGMPNNPANFMLASRSEVDFTELSIAHFYNIPRNISDSEYKQHFNNPEQTLYWQDEVLKSAFLPQSTLDALKASIGSWRPLCENESAGAWMRNHALPMPVSHFDLDNPSNINTWVNEGDGIYSFDSANTYRPVDFTASTIGTDRFFIEFEVFDYVSGDVEFFLTNGDSDVGCGSVTANGVYRLSVIGTNNTGLRMRSKGNGLVAKVRLLNTYSLADLGLTEIANRQSTVTTNSQAKSKGLQSVLFYKDAFGLPINPARNRELIGDGRSYVDPHDIRLDGDWCISAYVDNKNIQPDEYDEFFSLELYDSSNVWLDDIRAYLNPSNLDIQSERAGRYWGMTGETRGVITFEKVGSDVSLYFNGVHKHTSSFVFSYAVIQPLLTATQTYGELKGVLGSLSIAETYDIKDVKKIATNHGVIIS